MRTAISRLSTDLGFSRDRSRAALLAILAVEVAWLVAFLYAAYWFLTR